MNAHSPVRLLIHGATGRMGQALLRLCREEATGCEVVAAVARRLGSSSAAAATRRDD